MEVLKMQSGQLIVKQEDTVNQWYLIQEGTVIQKKGFAEISLGKNSIIGILETERFLCDYIASTDVTLVAIPCKNAEDLKKLFQANENYRGSFLKAAIWQRHQMLSLYFDLQKRMRQYHAFVQTLYSDYKNLCNTYQLDEQSFERMDRFTLLEMQNQVEPWEFEYSISLIKKYLAAYLQLMLQDNSLCIGAIMEAASQMQSVMLGIGEMTVYLTENKDVLLDESENDLFYLYFELAVRAGKRQNDLAPLKKEMNFLIGFLQKIKIYEDDQIAARVKQYQDYDFENSGAGSYGVDLDVTKEDCLAHIMRFGEFSPSEIEDVRQKLQAYLSLPDMMSTDSDAYKLRKQLTPIFYDIYTKVFFQKVKDEEAASPIIDMFLNFGFLDTQFAGEDNAKQIYDLTGRMKMFDSQHIFTIYEWLKSIYKGRKEPSKNDFDLDYPGYLLEQRKNGDLTPDQVKKLEHDREAKVKFEINNMFASANRITYGKITTFCPILGGYDLINAVEKMAVTVERLESALNKVREIDFSVFYRETGFSGPGKDIMNHENIMVEVLPDMILMPNVGTKAMMWQETADKRRDSKGRFLFPIFTIGDIDDMMLETIGRFRWEMCRKIQGVRWNDIREKSLTAEYCDYIQFYRKNHDLSAEAKDKLKNALARAKNSYREVFVKDYQNWIRYESQGSFRLNKVARDILVQYCPFSKGIRADLKANPMYQNSIPKFEIENAKKVQRLTALYEKYKKAGGEITPELEGNLTYYEL